MTDPLQLIITCDDGGMSPGIDEMVIDLYKDGIASTVSVMSNMPYARAALNLYKDYPGLEVGAHLNLTEADPLSESILSTALVKQGKFAGRFQCFLQGFFLTESLRQAIFEELDAQIQVFVEENSYPAHISTHHHFQLLPGMRQVIYEIARKYQVKWIRNSRLEGAIIPYNPLIQRSQGKQQAKTAFIEPDYVVLIQAWIDKTPQSLLSELRRLHGMIELVVHPCTKKDAQFPVDILYTPAERHKELEYIRAFQAIAEGEIEIISLSS